MQGYASLTLFAVPVALAALMPGPAQTALVARVIARGSSGAAPFVAGMLAGNAIWLCFAVLGLSALALRFELLFVTVKWLGVAYLCVLAWRLWSAPATAPAAAADVSLSGSLRSTAGGLALTLGNPKAVLFFGAILPNTFDLAALTPATFVLILAVQVAIDATVQAGYVLLSGRAGRLLRSPQRLRLVNRAAAGIMAGSAAAIAARS
jgi:threonine/homoserine/homoserine lactone efflux protein